MFPCEINYLTATKKSRCLLTFFMNVHPSNDKRQTWKGQEQLIVWTSLPFAVKVVLNLCKMKQSFKTPIWGLRISQGIFFQVIKLLFFYLPVFLPFIFYLGKCFPGTSHWRCSTWDVWSRKWPWLAQGSITGNKNSIQERRDNCQLYTVFVWSCGSRLCYRKGGILTCVILNVI